MRHTVSLLVLCAALLGASESRASASYANRSVSLGLGGLKLLGDNSELISGAAQLNLEGTLYLENGWDLYLRPQLMLMYQTALVGPMGEGGLVVGGGGQFGIRYFFSEESLRPFAGVHLSGLYINRASGDKGYGGIGVQAGLDYFVGESVSIGARAYGDLYYTLNKPLLFAVGGTAVVSVYF